MALYLGLGKPFGMYCNPYITVPTSKELLRIADEFNEICNMPNCMGSRDGTSCYMNCPPNAGFYISIKKLSLIELLGVADANCCFTLTDAGAYNRGNYSSVFGDSSLGKAFRSGDLNVPPIRNIRGTSISIMLYFVQDKAFPLKPEK